MTATYNEVLLPFKQDILSLSAAILSEPSTNNAMEYLNGIHSAEAVIRALQTRWAYGSLQYGTLQQYRTHHKKYLTDTCRAAIQHHAHVFNAAHLVEDNNRPMHQISNIAKTVHKYTNARQMGVREIPAVIGHIQTALSDTQASQILALDDLLKNISGYRTPDKHKPAMPIVTLRKTATETTRPSHSISSIDVSSIIDHTQPSYMPPTDLNAAPVTDNKYSDDVLIPLDHYNRYDLEEYPATKKGAILSSDHKLMTYTSRFVFIPGSIAAFVGYASSLIGVPSPLGVGIWTGGVIFLLYFIFAIYCEYDMRTKYQALKRLEKHPAYKGESIFTIKKKRERYLNEIQQHKKCHRSVTGTIDTLKQLYIIDDTPYFGFMFLRPNDDAKDKTLQLNIPTTVIDVTNDRTIGPSDRQAYRQYSEANAPADQTVIDAVFDVYYQKERAAQKYIESRIETLNNNKPNIEATPYYQTMRNAVK